MEQKDFSQDLLKQIQHKEELQEVDLLWITQQIYTYYTQDSFQGEVRWSNRLKTTGANIRYHPRTQKGVIQVNKKYVEKFGRRELLEILRHELTHYYLFKKGKMKHGHGEIFKKTLTEIFHSQCFQAKYNEDIYRYTYGCGNCGSLYRSVRRINRAIYCGRCVKENGGKIQESFRMVFMEE